MSTPTLVPVADRAPSLASRVLTIHATDVTEGAPAPDHFTFSLPCALRVPSDDVILRPGGVKVRLVDGRAKVRLPVYSPSVQTIDGSTDWVIKVSPSWGSPYAIRVPAGTSEINLADLPAVRPLTRREQQYAITGVGVTVTEATNAGGSATYTNGQLDLKIQVPSFKPSTVYPYIDETAEARAKVYRDEVLGDVNGRLAEVTTAYEVAVAQGYVGTVEEWLAHLVGARGPVGEVYVERPDEGVWVIGTEDAEGSGETAVEDPIHAFEADGAPSPGAGIALATKADQSHTHPTSEVNGLDATLATVGQRLGVLEDNPAWVDLPYPKGVGHAGSGSPFQYLVKGNVVRLRGRIAPNSGVFQTGNNYVVATIPAAVRPAYTQRTVFAGGSSSQWGRIEVSYSSGEISIAAISGDMSWADLSGISWTLD